MANHTDEHGRSVSAKSKVAKDMRNKQKTGQPKGVTRAQYVKAITKVARRAKKAGRAQTYYG